MPKIKIANINEINEGQGKLISVNGKELALFKINNEFFAIDNTCPHRGGSLSEGWLENNIINCPLHGWQFDVKTGKNTAPGVAHLNSYKILVENEEIFIVE